MAAVATESPGVVTADALYRLDEFQARMKMGRHAMRQARRDGLRVLYIGRQAYVRGADALEFFAAHSGQR